MFPTAVAFLQGQRIQEDRNRPPAVAKRIRETWKKSVLSQNSLLDQTAAQTVL